MMNVYAASWCPHCRKTIEFLRKMGVEFNTIDIETAPDAVVQKVIEVNGGDDWVVPTIEVDGQWRPGKLFDEISLMNDLRAMGIRLQGDGIREKV